MRWRTKRKFIYTSIALVPLVVIVGVIYAATFFPTPTCSDGIKNQGEAGVDCGDICNRICQAPIPEVDVVWSRSFQVSDNVYNAAAYIENPNVNLIAKDVSYKFSVYDRDNILITERRGSLNILPQPVVTAFVPGVVTQGIEVGRMAFELTSTPYWETPLSKEVRFEIQNRNLDVSENPRLSLDIVNENPRPVANIVLAALIFDTSGEAVHVSQTTIDRLDLQGSESIIFTWRQPFPGDSESYQTEIIPISYQLD